MFIYQENAAASVSSAFCRVFYLFPRQNGHDDGHVLRPPCSFTILFDVFSAASVYHYSLMSLSPDRHAGFSASMHSISFRQSREAHASAAFIESDAQKRKMRVLAPN
jgi:hypothetical protein